MVRHSRKVFLCLIVIYNLFFLTGCTELGDFLAIEFKIQGDGFNLSDFENLLPESKLGESTNCLARKSRVENKQWIGICIKEENIIVYRAFSAKYKIVEKGITTELLNSEGYEEMSKLSNKIADLIESKKIKFSKSEIKRIDFTTLNQRFNLTR